MTKLGFEYRQQCPKPKSSAGIVSMALYQAQYVGTSGEVSKGSPAVNSTNRILKKQRRLDRGAGNNDTVLRNGEKLHLEVTEF